jgi:hypothetical protein
LRSRRVCPPLRHIGRQNVYYDTMISLQKKLSLAYCNFPQNNNTLRAMVTPAVFKKANTKHRIKSEANTYNFDKESVPRCTRTAFY